MIGAVFSTKRGPVELRPSLRAAYTLHRSHGLTALVTGVLKQRVSAIRALAHATAVNATNDEIEALVGLALRPYPSQPMMERFAEVALGLLGATLQDAQEADAEPTESPTERKPADHGAMLDRLFEVATGWLGWCPEDALDATPRQIIAAHTGRVAMLKAIYGDGEKGKGAKSGKKTVRADEGAKVDQLMTSVMRRWGMSA